MIIVSQDKTRVTNFNNVNTLFATKEGKILSFDNSYKSEDDCSDILGNYKTEERAKEVLQEIVDFYTRKIFTNSSSNQRPILDDLVYRVPVDSNIQYINTDIAYTMPKE